MARHLLEALLFSNLVSASFFNRLSFCGTKLKLALVCVDPTKQKAMLILVFLGINLEHELQDEVYS